MGDELETKATIVMPDVSTQEWESNCIEVVNGACESRPINTGAFSARDVKRRIGKPADPCLMRALTAVIPPGSSVVDLGAGTGRYVRALAEAGYKTLGIDAGIGVHVASDRLVIEADLTDRRSVVGYRADWAICIEVGEHVPEPLLIRFLDTVCSVSAGGFICSWATPDQRGRNHVSCRDPSWVVEQFSARGWRLDKSATDAARDASRPSGFARKLLVFRRWPI